jgi:hypothetical protein
MLDDVAKLCEMYDEGIRLFGEPPLSFGLYDRRLLFPRSMVADQVRRETNQEVDSKRLDELARDGLFAWLGGAGDEGSELGVPLYVTSRIGLFLSLLARGWTKDELRDFADFEEWLVDDCVTDADLSYEDDDAAVVARHYRVDLTRLNDEIWSRLPIEQQPRDWHRTGWNGELAEVTTEELLKRRDSALASLERIKKTGREAESSRRKHRLGRAAFCLRFHEESIRVMLIAGDRAKLEAGFSPAVQFSGEHSLIPAPGKYEEFGRLNWQETLQAWRFLDDPDHFPLRLPGFTLVGGRVTLDSLLSAEEYERRTKLFELESYLSIYSEVVGERRCAHCRKLLKPSASARRRYCSKECSQAARQKAYRQRQKTAILRRPTRT